MKSRLRKVVVVLLAAVFLGSGALLARHYVSGYLQTRALQKLAESVRERPQADGRAQPDEESPDEESPDEEALPFEGYAALHAQNGDFAGWISIEGTTLDYPVMHAPDRQDYYLRRSFDKGYSTYGVPYLKEDCDLDAPSDNLVVYGHHMTGGQMFGVLESYADRAFYEEHRRIRLDTLTERREYEIIAVFKTTVYDEAGFPYYQFVSAGSEAAFDDYVAMCRALSLYDIEERAQYGDQLITLSTCEYTQENGRFVVVGRRVETEIPAVGGED